MKPRLAVALLALALGGCAAYAEVGPPGPGPGRAIGSGVQVPPGHLPPPGECRIWFPDRPPGHQPPPGDCASLRWRVPPGAVLVRG